ncbi:hypothetical protein PVT67_07420 [Gallaecimonas kandeliae]|uniref:hypothetical protein n=1 Tax=Gallaecimonas kandeliae TaxID=3029055 RepID=UPI00264A4CFF|nr:hypothetical protein [Gallaecimonas kandeliae]WKE67059.1 hypothetical protein PVT67_07420 [Gallaecimonas kandeliae]
MSLACNRFFDPSRERTMVKVLPGQYFVTGGEELLATTLGSCVCACVWDPLARIGGLNHFMLPEGNPDTLSQANRYGTHAMESLINGLLALGAHRDRLLAKLFGGARVFGEGSVGDMNIDFVRRFVAREGLQVVSECLGGQLALKVLFEPQDGRAWVKRLKQLPNDTLIRREVRLANAIAQETRVELFK